MRNGYVACGRLNIVILGTVVSTSTCPLPYKIMPDIKSSGVGTPKAGVFRLTQERQLYQYHSSKNLDSSAQYSDKPPSTLPSC